MAAGTIHNLSDLPLKHTHTHTHTHTHLLLFKRSGTGDPRPTQLKAAALLSDLQLPSSGSRENVMAADRRQGRGGRGDRPDDQKGQQAVGSPKGLDRSPRAISCSPGNSAP